MKKFMISLAIASFAMVSSVNAQETVSEVVVPTKEKAVVTNSFGSNWFIGVNGGVNIYNGVYMNGESAFDHLSPALNVYVGKWHTPGFGWRIAYQGLNIQTYEEFDHTMFMNFHFDAMFNLSNLICGYNEKRIWNFIPYVGVGWAGREAMNHEKGTGRMTSGDITGSLSANYGIINTFRVSKHWAINLELAGAFFRNGFSGINGQNGHDMMWSANLGVTYKFNKVGWDAAVDVDALQALYAAQVAEAVADLDEAKGQIANLKKENADLNRKLGEAKKELDREKNKKAVVAPEYSVFFDFDSSKINSKKEKINIAAYAEAIKNSGATSVKVTGYTDTIGSEEYNTGLAERRANAVAEILKENGVDAEIEIVPVPNSDKESSKSLNRRAVIVME